MGKVSILYGIELILKLRETHRNSESTAERSLYPKDAVQQLDVSSLTNDTSYDDKTDVTKKTMIRTKHMISTTKWKR